MTDSERYDFIGERLGDLERWRVDLEGGDGRGGRLGQIRGAIRKAAAWRRWLVAIGGSVLMVAGTVVHQVASGGVAVGRRNATMEQLVERVRELERRLADYRPPIHVIPPVAPPPGTQGDSQ